jgi:hypothetical protein
VVERVSLSVARAWPAAKSRIHNRQITLLLLQFAAASLQRALSPCKGVEYSVVAGMA